MNKKTSGLKNARNRVFPHFPARPWANRLRPPAPNPAAGCAVLHNMALAAPALPRLRAAGAVEAAAAAVRSFPGDRRLLGQALPALRPGAGRARALLA